MAMAYSWSAEKTFQLIELYEANQCLYDTKAKQYHDRNLKSRVLAEMAADLDVPGRCIMLIIQANNRHNYI